MFTTLLLQGHSLIRILLFHFSLNNSIILLLSSNKSIIIDELRSSRTHIFDKYKLLSTCRNSPSSVPHLVGFEPLTLRSWSGIATKWAKLDLIREIIYSGTFVGLLRICVKSTQFKMCKIGEEHLKLSVAASIIEALVPTIQISYI